MKRLFYVLLILGLLLAWRDWEQRAISHPPGVLVPSAPRQQTYVESQPLAIDDFRLTRRARFTLEARVLSREDYWLGRESDLSPLDLALGWGVMSDQAVLDRIDIRQSGRWYFTRYELPAPVPDAAIIRNSSNMHMIPANSWVRDKLKDTRRGDLLFLDGFLVDVADDAGFTWSTSLSRNDTGNGSCEIFYVENVEIADRG